MFSLNLRNLSNPPFSLSQSSQSTTNISASAQGDTQSPVERCLFSPTRFRFLLELRHSRVRNPFPFIAREIMLECHRWLSWSPRGISGVSLAFFSWFCGSLGVWFIALATEQWFLLHTLREPFPLSMDSLPCTKHVLCKVLFGLIQT